MSTKIIHFIVNGGLEKIEFSTDDQPDDIKDVFRSAGDACPHDIVKLYSPSGNLVNITPDLESNLPSEPYRLVIAATNGRSIAEEAGINVMDIEKRLQALEAKVLVDGGGIPDNVRNFRHQIEDLRSKIEVLSVASVHEVKVKMFHFLEYRTPKLDWIVEGVERTTIIPAFGRQLEEASTAKPQSRRSLPNSSQKVLNYELDVSPEVKHILQGVNFNNWQWDDPEMLVLLQEMYIDLGLLDDFLIPNLIFHQWLCEVYKNYNKVPFHNFKHSFMVTQMMYGLILLLNLRDKLSKEDIFILLTSAVCHDLDHPGYNNTYQINARTELALRYNDASPLENHHCYVAFKILSKPECNILKNVTPETFTRIRCILATDMARHNEILENFKNIVQTFDFGNARHRNQLMMILIKCADISNECRPMEVAEPWIDCLLQEFFNQSDVEKKEGLPVSPFMDREKVNKNSSQVNFIKIVLMPLFESLAILFPQVQEPVLSPLQDALSYYQKLSNSAQASTEKLTKQSSYSTSNSIHVKPIKGRPRSDSSDKVASNHSEHYKKAQTSYENGIGSSPKVACASTFEANNRKVVKCSRDL